MARNHVWKFLVNQAGEPIEGAHIFVYKAGTTDPVWVYFDEFGSAGSRSPSGQVSTLTNGYFEFWIDEDEEFDVCNTEEVDSETATSYGFNQKFKLRWEKTGIASGEVDYIDIFPANRYFQPADLENCADEGVASNTEMNKVVSNYLVCRWENHVDGDFREITNPTLIHGLDYLNTLEPNTTVNKILSNQMGWLWDAHEYTNVYEYSLSGSSWGGQAYTKSPHDLWPVNIADIFDTKVNKVVSNQMMLDIYTQLEAIKYQVFTISTAVSADAQWSLGTDGYEAILGHNLDVEFPDVTVYGYYSGSWMLIKTADVEYIDSNTLKISIDHDTIPVKVRVTT